MKLANCEPLSYIYTYTSTIDEKALLALEMRSFFGKESDTGILESSIEIHPDRSPFMKERIDVIFEAEDIPVLINQVEQLELGDLTFKVIAVKTGDTGKISFDKRRKLEREVGLRIPAKPELVAPDLIFGIMIVNGRWVFGPYHQSEPIWLQHQKKPNSYSTSLNTRVARAVANIAVPDPAGIKAIDPCCGIGTVVVEALSMGIDIVGSDLNHLIIPGVRENIAHFGFDADVSNLDIHDVTGKYDVAIIDMPYNLCNFITPEEQLAMLQSTRDFARKAVIVTVEQIDHLITEAGFAIVDRGFVKKGLFVREVIVCE